MRKNDGAARPQRVSRTRRSQQVLSSERRHRRVKKFAATAKEDGENAFVSGFHVRVKLDNGQRASRMISDAYCIRSDDDATTTITTTRRFFPPPPPPSRRRCLLSPRLPHPSPLFPSSGSKLSASLLPARPIFPRGLPSLFLSFFLLFLSPLLTRNLLLFLSTLYNSLYNRMWRAAGSFSGYETDGPRCPFSMRTTRRRSCSGRFREARYL